MLEDKRRFERFDLSLVTKIGRDEESPRYSLGLTRNISREGLSIETRDFDFKQDNDLKLELRSPTNNTKVPLIGSVVWKRREENSNIAGVKFIFEDDKSQNEILEEISFFGNIPRESLFRRAETQTEIESGTGEEAAEILSAGEKEVLSEKTPVSGFVKQYLENGGCKVTFRLPKEVARDAHSVALVGDFNDWSTTAAQMTRLEDGSFQITLDLTPVTVYRFRYLIDGHRWENDAHADKYIANDFGWHDSAVIV